MAMTLAELRSAVRSRLGWPATDGFLPDAELTAMLQNAASELYRFLLTIEGPDYFTQSTTITTVAGTAEYALAYDVARVLRFDCDIGGGHRVQFRRGNYADHFFARTGVGWNLRQVSYFLSMQGTLVGSVTFDPVPQAVYTVNLVYLQDPLPSPTDVYGNFTADGDVNPLVHDEYLILDAMAQCIVKEDDDPSVVLGQKAAFEQRLKMFATPKDVGRPPVIADVRSVNIDGIDGGDWWDRRL